MVFFFANRKKKSPMIFPSFPPHRSSYIMDSINLGVRGMSFASLDMYVCVSALGVPRELARIPPVHSMNVTTLPASK